MSLEKILAKQLSRVNKLKLVYPVDSLKEKIKSYNNFVNFKEKLIKEKNKVSVIAEMKKASPSAGTIIKNYKPIEIAENYYNNGASCLSILTEEEYFQGKLEHIDEVKKKVKLPVLMKDFFTDDYQVYLSKACGADCILIILSAVNDSLADKIYQKANELSLTTLVEVHNEDEAKKALKYKEAIIGINNRNLSTLKTDITTTYKLYEILTDHKQPIVCESGLKSEKEVEDILKKTKINNFLIGESLLRNLDKNSTLLKKITQIRP